MSGDISDVLPIPDEAGIIPRVLHKLFDRLNGDDEAGEVESSVKCSFIELYNEELRDLLAPDDSNAKLKIYDDASKTGRTTTLVQGMEETHIRTASKGIQLLREGSHKRQVAATKCNDLSSRSHTVFAVTVYSKRRTEAGEDYILSGKLNLVDLAGSENIQRSGAENKRAAEAGLINKSLLTLGRVINALVDKSSHIPYRESKLTRLLQDSLGGRTKTCIIATLSPAKSNLEETISTLDYAFRAKNIRNKPQMNQLVSKKTLLREFTVEIEKLKSELIATRQRNGVYLSTETYEGLATESESRRILSEEQRDKIETMETNLRNKSQELFHLTTTFQSLKRESEETRSQLESTKNVLDSTELVLAHTRRSLAEENHLRQAHQQTEEELAAVGQDFLSTLGTTTDHVNKLHSKLRRRSDLHAANKERWIDSQRQVTSVTDSVAERVQAVQRQQKGLLSGLFGRMQSFVGNELQQLQSSQALLQEQSVAFQSSEAKIKAQTDVARNDIDGIVQGIGTLRDEVRSKAGDGLDALSAATQKIGAGIANELDMFHEQLQNSYVSLGREFKGIFEDLTKQIRDQQQEAARLRQQIADANCVFSEATQASQAGLQQVVEDEKKLAAAERAELSSKIAALLNESAAAQEARMEGHLESSRKRVKISQSEYHIAQQACGSGMDAWECNANALIQSSIESRETVKNKLKSDWASASSQMERIAATAKSVHLETAGVVESQTVQMDSQLSALDGIVCRVRNQHEVHRNANDKAFDELANDVQDSYQSIGRSLEDSSARNQALETDIQERMNLLTDTLTSFEKDGEMRGPLDALRKGILARQMEEYTATGETPAKTHYSYPTTLPRTDAHVLLQRLREKRQPRSETGGLKSSSRSPKKTAVFPGLRERDANVPVWAENPVLAKGGVGRRY